MNRIFAGDMDTPHSPRRPPGVDDFYKYASTVANWPAIIATSRGFVGVATCAVISGDILVLARTAPFLVLRPTGKGLHQFRGLAYLEGLMDLQPPERNIEGKTVYKWVEEEHFRIS
jgi:hypothetical protein